MLLRLNRKSGKLTRFCTGLSLAVMMVAYLLFTMTSAAFAMDEPVHEPVYTIDAVATKVKMGDELIVTINAEHLSDVYGYELRLIYHPDVLKVREATADWEGFTVPPIIRDGEIVFAHTKIGKVSGENGDVQLAKIRFEAIGYGETSVRLVRVKLVDSQVNSTTASLNESITLQVAPLTAIFSDIEGHWAEYAILSAERMGWIKGYPDGRFGPQDVVTRAQFTTMLSRALKLTDLSRPGLTYIDADQIPDFAREHVSRATAAGIVLGFPDRTFGPHRLITRSEITVMIMRAARYDEKAAPSQPLGYRDADQIGDWAYPAVAAATELGLVQGVGDNRFAPQGITTRAEAVVLILRLLEHLQAQEAKELQLAS
jgi:hypothetical protein